METAIRQEIPHADPRPLSGPVRYEILPMKGAIKQLPSLPEGACVTVTCSPAIGLDASLEFALSFASQRPDIHVVPHVAARRVRGFSHINAILSDLGNAGINEIFVISGDATDKSGPYVSGLALIRDIRNIMGDGITIGIPGYPDGHAFISDEDLHEALLSKSRLADHIITQLCFDADKVGAWITALRREGVTLPVYLGLAGPISRTKLFTIGARIGVGRSLSFLKRNGSIAGNLLSGNYRPDALMSELGASVASGGEMPAGIHINTFNQITDSVNWVRSFVV